MEKTALILSLLGHLLDPEFGAEQVVEAIGETSRQTSARLWLKPSDPVLAEAVLHFEDLKAGDHLMTTIELSFASAWIVEIGELERAFGESDRWLPRTGPKRSRGLQFVKKGKHFTCVAIFKVDESSGEGDSLRLTVPSVILRRVYPGSKE